MQALSELVKANWPWIIVPFNSLFVSSGLVDFRYAVSYGYSCCMMSNGLLNFLAHPEMDPFSISGLLSIGYILFGARLFGFLYHRRGKKDFVDHMKKDTSHPKLPLFVKLMIILNCIGIFSAHAYPLHISHLITGWNLTSILGTAMWSVGFLGEAVADWQKQSCKDDEPNAPVTTGLYRLCRHPNYFFEIVMHYGFFLTSFSGCSSWYDYAIGLIAPTFLSFFVLNGASKRLSQSQNKRYAENEEFAKYRDATPSLFPLIGSVVTSLPKPKTKQ